METLLRGLLNMYETAVRQICKDGQLINELNKVCKERSNKVAATTLADDYGKARAELHEAMEQRNEVEADRAAVYQNMCEVAERSRIEALALLEKEIGTDPLMVDGAVVELLRNDLYSDQELLKEAERFKNNPTMLRLIGKYAGKRAGDDMQALAAEIERKRGSRIIEAFDELVKVCDTACRRARMYSNKASDDEQVKQLDDVAMPIMEKAINLLIELKSVKSDVK